ncbi:MAG: hypothetical protein ACSLFF_08690 [Solirubrobacterales bacterium]
MSEAQAAYVSDLNAALADARDQLEATATLLAERGERSKADELADIEKTLADAEITVSKKFRAISELASGETQKAA